MANSPDHRRVEAFGAAVRLRREELGLSQEGLPSDAKWLGVWRLPSALCR
jgi:hypothetical protein